MSKPPQLVLECGSRVQAPSSYRQTSRKSVPICSNPWSGRGASYADIDDDGDLDILIATTGRAPRLLRNDQELGHHWLRLKLVDETGVGNRDAIGAWVEVKAGSILQRKQVTPTRSYLSQVELPLTFGIGTAEAIDSIKVTWPDGTDQILDTLPVDQMHVVERSGGK